MQDGRQRAPVFLQLDQLRARKVALKENEGSARGPAEAVDGLVRISDREDVAFLSRQFLQDLDLGEIDVLKFVHQDEAGARPARQFAVLLQQLVSVGDHVAEGAQVVFPQHAFHGGKDAGNFAATPHDFFVRQVAGVF